MSLLKYSLIEVTSKHISRLQRGGGSVVYKKDYRNWAKPQENTNEPIVICNALADRSYSFEEQEALTDMFLIQQRKLTPDEVERVLFLVALDAYWESIPF